MADEELDAALVERVREATFGKWCFYTDVATETLRVKRALLSLPIPAAALNALARGEATVVPKRITREICDARQDVHGFSPLDEEAWVRVQHGGERQSEWAAMLAASPYAAKE